MSTQIQGLLRTAAMALLLLCASSVYAQEAEETYETGVEAYEADDFAKAEEIWLPLAEAGDAQAQYALAKLYENGGEGVLRSLTKAADWYLLAAESGMADAQNNLALLYIQGHGVPRSQERAFELWLDAADNGHQQAQYNVALAYYEGMGTDQHHLKAAEWFERAASSGLAESQFALAEMYRLGVGVDENPAHALYWYELAEEQGHERAGAEVQELEEAGVSSSKPDSVLGDNASVSGGEEEPEQVERSEREPEAQEETAASDEPSEEAAPNDQDQQGSDVESVEGDPEPTEADDGMDVVGGDDVPAPDGQTTARNLFPLNRLPENNDENGAVKKNDDAAVTSQEDASGAVELYPKRVDPLAVEDTSDEDSKRQAEPAASGSSEEKAPAGAISTDALPEAEEDSPSEEETTDSSGSPAQNDVVSDEKERNGASDDGSDQDKDIREQDNETLAFALWLGSMATEEGAQRLWDEANSDHPEPLAKLTYETQEVQTDSGTYLRVLAVGYETDTEAREVCATIESRDDEAFCQVVKAP